MSAGFRGTRTFQRSAKPIVSILGSRNDSLEFSKEMKKREISHIIQKSVGRSWFRGTSHWNPFGRSTHTPTLGGALVLSLPFSWCRCFGSQRMSLGCANFSTYLLRLSSIDSIHCRSRSYGTPTIARRSVPHDHCPVTFHLSLIRNPVDPLRNSTSNEYAQSHLEY